MNNAIMYEWEDLTPKAQKSAFNAWFEGGYGYYDRYESELFNEINSLLGVQVKDWFYTPGKYDLTLGFDKNTVLFNDYNELLSFAEIALKQDSDAIYYTSFFQALKNVCEKNVCSDSLSAGSVLANAIFEVMDILSTTVFLDNYKNEFSYDNFVEFHCGEYLYSMNGQTLSPVPLAA